MWLTFDVLMIIGAVFFGIGVLLLVIAFLFDVLSNFNLDTEWLMKPGIILAVIGFLLFAVFGITVSVHDDKLKENACVTAGGHYEVVRTETQYIYDVSLKVSMPQEIDIYGCVK